PIAGGTEHQQGIKIEIVRNTLKTGAIFVDDVEVEVAAVPGIGHVGSEDDALAVWQEVGREIGGAVVGDLVLVVAVGVHHPDFKIAGTDQAARKQVLVVDDLFRRLRMLGAVDDLLSVIRPEWTAIVAQFMRELLHVAAVGVHGVNVEIAVAGRGKDDLLAVTSDSGFRVVAWRMSEGKQVAAIRFCGIDLVGVVDWPDVAARVIGLGRALSAGRVRRGKQDAIARGKKVAAGGAPLAGRDQLGRTRLTLGRIDSDRIDLIARDTFALVLEDQVLVISRPVRLCVLPAEGKLADIAQVLLAGVGERGLSRDDSVWLLSVYECKSKDEH